MSDVRRMKDFNSVRIRSSNDLTTFISGRAKILTVYVSEASSNDFIAFISGGAEILTVYISIATKIYSSCFKSSQDFNSSCFRSNKELNSAFFRSSEDFNPVPVIRS